MAATAIYAMPSRRVGRTGLLLSEIGFGAASLGNLYQSVTDAESRATMDAAWTAGVRYFDTAPYYGFGLSERRVGDALRAVDRNGFVLSTKVGRLLAAASQITQASEAVCDAHGVTLAAAALQFPLAHPNVSSVIPGLSSPRRVAQTMALFDEAIAPEFWHELKRQGLLREDAPTPTGVRAGEAVM